MYSLLKIALPTAGELKAIATPPLRAECSSMLTSNVRPVLVNLDNSGNVLAFTAHADIVDAGTKDAWSAGTPGERSAGLTLAAVKIICGDFEQILAFPIPIDGDRSKLRIARRSFYVEVS